MISAIVGIFAVDLACVSPQCTKFYNSDPPVSNDTEKILTGTFSLKKALRMKTPDFGFLDGPVVEITPAATAAEVLIVCEHASNHIPAALHGLGLSEDQRRSHIAWDPGAAGVAITLADQLNAPLVCGAVSRLVYDCNRPPDAADAIPVRSEIHDVPGNCGLTGEARKERELAVYHPFRDAVADIIQQHRTSLKALITVHSFTPVYQGSARDVELGILHGKEDGLAQAMMETRPETWPYVTRLNEPYSAADGVAHTLDLHGVGNGLWNVMLEIRNDLISTPEARRIWGEALARWSRETLARIAKVGVA